MAALELVPKTWPTQSGNGVATAPWLPPTMFRASPKIFCSCWKLCVTLGSVQGIWCCASALYLSGPAIRRYTFSNQSVSVHPDPPHMAKGAVPNCFRVVMFFVRSSNVAGGVVIPACLNVLTLSQTVLLLAALK